MLRHTLATCRVDHFLKTAVADQSSMLSIGQLLHRHNCSTYNTKNVGGVTPELLGGNQDLM